MAAVARKIDENERLLQLAAMDKSTLPADGGPRFNRLIFATSPYLLQHAENPVDWYPWGEEAFARAKAEDKPVFLSIGYATCHWCHVMAHESFEDSQVADVLNRHFVAIKVDREERPDIDGQFMLVAQIMTGSAGWPLQMILTPDKKPFFAFTYMPKTARMGMPGIIGFLEQMATLWHTERERVERNCAVNMDALTRMNRPAPSTLPGSELPAAAFQELALMYDGELGGFGRAPKFPMPHYISFLLRYWRRSGEPAALSMVEHTLRQMRLGGIYDQLGFGFHRYSVDRQWLVPHFEKMLYDQALVSMAYLEAFQVTGDDFYRSVAEEIFIYLLREMTSDEGGFYGAQDADTEGEEGTCYLWTPAQVENVLGTEPARLFCRFFDVTEKGNFEGKNILHQREPIDSFALREGVTPELLRTDLELGRERLLQAREKRIRPLTDRKVLTSWNGFTIAALARGFAVTGDGRWIGAAERAAAFIRERMVDSSGRLMRSFHLGRPVVPGFLDDYACYVHGLIELYQATVDKVYLEEALHYSREMLRLFRDEGSGGLFETGSDGEEVLVRSLNAYDGVIPSGNSVAAMNLLKLGRITGDDDLFQAGEAVLRAFMGKVAGQPVAYLYLIMAHDYLVGEEVEVTLAGKREEPGLRAMLRAIGRRFIPGLVLRFAEGGSADWKTVEGKATAYVCARGACRPPMNGVEELEMLLDEVV